MPILWEINELPLSVIEVIVYWVWPSGMLDVQTFKCLNIVDIQNKIVEIKELAKEGTVIVSTRNVTYR